MRSFKRACEVGILAAATAALLAASACGSDSAGDADSDTASTGDSGAGGSGMAASGLGCPMEGDCAIESCDNDDGECERFVCPELDLICEVRFSTDAAMTELTLEAGAADCAFDALLAGESGLLRVITPCSPGGGDCVFETFLLGNGLGLSTASLPGHPAGASVTTRGPAAVLSTSELESCRAKDDPSAWAGCLTMPLNVLQCG